MVIMAPKDENELQHMLKTALDYPGPAALRYARGAAEGVALDETIQALPLGQGEVLRDGEDVAIWHSARWSCQPSVLRRLCKQKALMPR